MSSGWCPVKTWLVLDSTLQSWWGGRYDCHSEHRVRRTLLVLESQLRWSSGGLMQFETPQVCLCCVAAMAVPANQSHMFWRSDWWLCFLTARLTGKAARIIHHTTVPLRQHKNVSFFVTMRAPSFCIPMLILDRNKIERNELHFLFIKEVPGYRLLKGCTLRSSTDIVLYARSPWFVLYCIG